MTYLELENLQKNCTSEVCVFGAGQYGKTWGFDLITAAGFKVYFYCDNKVVPGTVIRDGIEVRDIQYLYKNKEKIQVFLIVSHQYQESIIRQLHEHGLFNIINIDYVLLSEILDSIDVSGEEAVKQRYHAIYNDVEFLERKFERRTGYKLDMNNPTTFNEKLQWLKVYNHNPEYTHLVDKYAVKEYVRGKIGEEYIIPTLEVWDNFDEINFSKLPKQFVLKCTHDSGSIVIVDEANKLNGKEVKEKLNRALSINYFWTGREWPYKNIKPKIIAEKYMSDGSEIIDYKFMCFNGKVKTIFTCTDRLSADGLKVTFFDTNWEKLPFERHYPASREVINPPQNLQLMIELSEKLCAEIPFVRVDFYEIKGKVYFGELTFFPGGGMEEFTPQKWDKILGDWIKLPEK